MYKQLLTALAPTLLLLSGTSSGADPKYPPLDYDPERTVQTSAPPPQVVDGQQGSNDPAPFPAPLPENPYLAPIPYGAPLPAMNEQEPTANVNTNAQETLPNRPKDAALEKSVAPDDAVKWPPASPDHETDEPAPASIIPDSHAN